MGQLNYGQQTHLKNRTKTKRYNQHSMATSQGQLNYGQQTHLKTEENIRTYTGEIRMME
jgi:hypothetical protein